MSFPTWLESSSSSGHLPCCCLLPADWKQTTHAPTCCCFIKALFFFFLFFLIIHSMHSADSEHTLNVFKPVSCCHQASSCIFPASWCYATVMLCHRPANCSSLLQPAILGLCSINESAPSAAPEKLKQAAFPIGPFCTALKSKFSWFLPRPTLFTCYLVVLLFFPFLNAVSWLSSDLCSMQPCRRPFRRLNSDLLVRGRLTVDGEKWPLPYQ